MLTVFTETMLRIKGLGTTLTAVRPAAVLTTGCTLSVRLKGSQCTKARPMRNVEDLAYFPNMGLPCGPVVVALRLRYPAAGLICRRPMG